MISISSQFDSGNIEIIDASRAQDIVLRIRPDAGGEFLQWFHFRVQGAKAQRLGLRVDNASDCSYADGWHGYQCAASYDRQHWFRIPTTAYDGRQLRIDFTPAQDSVWLAYFEPYSHERHLDLIARSAQHEAVRLERLGASVQGRDIDCLQVGSASKRAINVWVIARQHPGESMAQWCAEGLLARLLDEADPVARALRERAVLHIVPNVNPDGAFLGHLRSNAAGVNLNREWLAPDAARSPEVLAVRAAMERTGVDLFLDLHGDETLPYVFIDGSHMVPGYGQRNLDLQEAFLQNLLRDSPDFQRLHGYADNRFSEELLTLASKWVAHRFNCTALTLEMPFKDNANAPHAATGWNGARSQRLGAALLGSIWQHVQALLSAQEGA